MKFLSVFFLIGSAALAGCGSGANNASTNAANMRGANTNTGYVMNSETNVKPAMPVNATNISPPSMNKVMGNTNSNSKANMANTRKP